MTQKDIECIRQELPRWDWKVQHIILAFLACVADRQNGGDGSFRPARVVMEEEKPQEKREVTRTIYWEDGFGYFFDSDGNRHWVGEERRFENWVSNEYDLPNGDALRTGLDPIWWSEVSQNWSAHQKGDWQQRLRPARVVLEEGGG